MEELKKLYTQHTGLQVVTCDEIAGSGSNRKYYRLHGSDGSTLIGVVGTSLDENHAFCLGFCLFAVVSIINIIAVRNRVMKIWNRKE